MPLHFRMSRASFASARVAECLDDAGSWSRAKLQKPQRALQALVMAKWHVPGPPVQAASSAIFQIEGRLGALPSNFSPFNLITSSSETCVLSDLNSRVEARRLTQP